MTTSKIHLSKWGLSILSFLMLLPAWQGSFAPDTPPGNQSVIVKGTSTIHDWEMEVQDFSGTVDYAIAETDGKPDIQSLYFKMDAKDLKSGKGAMDKNAYKALKTDEHQQISFKLSQVKKMEAKDKGYNITASGILTVAGVSKTITLTSFCELSPSGAMTAKGSYQLDMTDFQVEPPSFMFGTVTTGEKVTIAYNAQFQPN